MFFKRGGGTETMFTQDEMKTCMHKLSIHRIKFIILLPKYRCVIDSLVGQLRLESQGSNRIGYVTEPLATEHHRNSDGARVLTPTQECKHCALIQSRNERCVLRVCLFRFLCSHSDIVRVLSNNCCTGWFTFPRKLCWYSV